MENKNEMLLTLTINNHLKKGEKAMVTLSNLLRLVALFLAIIAITNFTSFPTQLYAHPIAPILVAPPDIGWDSSPGFPPSAVNGITTFTPSTGTLSLTSTINSFLQGGVVPPNPVVGGNVKILASLTGTTFSGGLIHADFGTTGSPGWDIQFTDSVGNLALAGDLGDMIIDGIIGSTLGTGATVFSPSAGYLLPDFPSGAGMVYLEFNTLPTWSATSYTSGWSAESKGDAAPIPEPTTIALLGIGLASIIGYSRKRLVRK